MATGRVPTTANSPLTAKGDLFGYSTTQARVAVGSDGDTLVADSAASTGLRWQGNFAAGKNKIINGDFTINQRSFTTITDNFKFGFDRWTAGLVDGTTNSYSAQTFTPGSAPVSGYEATNFARLISAGQTLATAQTSLRQYIEDVRTLAGQTLTISFWAKAASGTPKLAIELDQNFGSGGSTVVNNYVGQVTLSTSWARYSLAFTLPSISGKTIGSSNYLALNIFASAGSNFNARTGSLGIQSNTFDFWGVQVEAGSVATAFQTATGTLQGELAACQRYYVRFIGNGGNDILSSVGWAPQTTNAHILFNFPVEMRVAPSSIESSTIELTDLVNEISAGTVTLSGNSTTFIGQANCATSGLTQYRPYVIRNDNNAAGYVAFSAEL